MIDYAGESKEIGKIDRLIPSDYVPKVSGETNNLDVLNALVYESSIVLCYHHKYVSFEKVDE